MSIMPEKITTVASYSMSGVLLAITHWIEGIDWQLVAIVTGIIVAIATYFTNLYFQRRVARAIEQASKRGVMVLPPDN